VFFKLVFAKNTVYQSTCIIFNYWFLSD